LWVTKRIAAGRSIRKPDEVQIPASRAADFVMPASRHRWYRGPALCPGPDAAARDIASCASAAAVVRDVHEYQEYAMEMNDPIETSLAPSNAAPAIPKRRRAKAADRQAKGDPRTATIAPDNSPAALRREVLRDALLASVEMLRRRRASDIPEGYIDDYVALNWLEWHGGGLRITTVGENICKQVSGRRACA
jgi:hypothetical protein